MDGSTLSTEWRTIVLGPYGADPRDFTFRVAPSPPTKSGRTKVFPVGATQGPTDPDVDDTLTNINFMDISGGIGVYSINPASDLNSYWWGIAECEGTDGWTMAREAVMAKPASYTGNHVPLGRVGTTTYGMWGTQLHKWDATAHTWGNSLATVGTLANSEGFAYFNEGLYVPLGASGYAIITESAPGTPVVTVVAGVAHPAYPSSAVTTSPKALAFAVWRELLYVLTTKVDGHYLISSQTGADNTWNWDQFNDTARSRYVKMETAFEPHTMVIFPNAQGSPALWVAGRRGLKIFNDNTMSFEDTNLTQVPPHPDFGKSVQVFRPGEAMYIAGGGGDLIQYTAGGAIVPASGPGGAKEGLGATRIGLPGGRRGSVVSQATDLFHLYALVQGETAVGASASIVEDTEGSDAVYVPGAVATSSVIANTGKGWHPKWESAVPGGVPTKIVVSDALTTDGIVDYRVFWGLGEESWSMMCRLSTHSSRQAIQTQTGEPFRSSSSQTGYQESYIEFGRYNGGSIATHKLASHAAILMEYATGTEYCEYQWYDEHSSAEQWETLGVATSDANDGEPRTILPFGMSSDAAFSEGHTFEWIRQRLRLVSSSRYLPPIVTAMSLSYLPIRQDAATKSYTIYLSSDLDEATNKTAEQVVQTLEALFSQLGGNSRFLYLQDGQNIYRAVISSISYGRGPTPDAAGSLQITVIQIPTGVPGLLGDISLDAEGAP